MAVPRSLLELEGPQPEFSASRISRISQFCGRLRSSRGVSRTLPCVFRESMRASVCGALRRHAAFRRPVAGRWLSSSKEDLTLDRTTRDGIRVVTLNNPSKFNGWNVPMLMSLKNQFRAASEDEACKAMILTGNGDYYCAGVDLASSLKPMMPAALHQMIYESNKAVFDTFLEFEKPLCVAMQGPVLGAALTTATLSDGIVASEKATFSTPFARLGVPPEGCSSVHFEWLMGSDNAKRMLGSEGWVPTAAEAEAVNLIDKCVPHDEVLDAAEAMVKGWLDDPNYVKNHRGYTDTRKLLDVNRAESLDLADAFLGTPFLQGQADFLESKGKTKPALAFKFLILTRPAWSLLLPSRTA